MRRLASKIKHELEVHEAEHYAAYENELQRIWPLDEENRKSRIEQFAKEYGFRLAYYKQGLCAIFQKIRDQSSQTRTLPFLRNTGVAIPSNPNPLRRHRLSQNRLQNLCRQIRCQFRRKLESGISCWHLSSIGIGARGI
jgi:hypothetical protein